MTEPLAAEYLLTDLQLKAIGCLTIETTRLDYVAKILIRALVGEVAGDLLVKGKTVGPVVDVLHDLAVERLRLDEALVKQYEVIHLQLKRDIDKRNTVIHGDLGASGPIALRVLMGAVQKGAAVAKKPKGGDSVQASAVLDVAHSMAKHSEALNYFLLDNIIAMLAPKRRVRKSGKSAVKPSA